MSMLIEKGADATAVNKDGLTTLATVAFKGSPQMIKMLIDAGAEVNAYDKNGMSPLMLAAAFNDDPQAINTFIQEGADVNHRDKKGNSVLWYAKLTAKPNPKVITMLIKAGAK